MKEGKTERKRKVSRKAKANGSEESGRTANHVPKVERNALRTMIRKEEGRARREEEIS